jgi:hypothetical protein
MESSVLSSEKKWNVTSGINPGAVPKAQARLGRQVSRRMVSGERRRSIHFIVKLLAARCTGKAFDDAV